MSKGKCEEMVYAKYRSVKCGKPSGYGRAGRYCQTHRWERPGDTEPVVGSFWRFVGGNLEEVPYIKRTPSTYIDTKGRRSNITSGYEKVFDTPEDAIADARDNLRRKVDAAQDRLSWATEELASLIAKYGDGS